MIAALKAEFRKLFTIRSTYVILLLCLGLEIFFAFYVTAYHADAKAALNPSALASEVTDAISFLALLCSIIGVLAVTHEYRYNTIMYSLTSSRSRSFIIFSKFLAVSIVAIIFAAVFSMLAPLLAKIGFAAHHVTLVPQQFHTWNLLWRAVIFGWGFSMFGLILAFIIRIQVGALAALFLIPSTVESLLTLLLKTKAVYLPFSALGAVIQKQADLTYGHAALVSSAYIVFGAIIAWILFLHRDAN